MDNNKNAFDFFMCASPKDIKKLGHRIGEKCDSMFYNDFVKDIIKPLSEGIEEGSHHKKDGGGKSINETTRERKSFGNVKKT